MNENRDEDRPLNLTLSPICVFLLGQLYETEFRKDSPGGMQASKQYFDVGPFNVADVKALAEALRGKTWSEVRGQSAV